MNKFNKGKLIGVVAASLSAVSLMGVGFATWVLQGTDDKYTGDLTVTVGEVQDKRVVFDGTPTLSEAKLAFDADGTNGSGGLIKAGDQTNKEDLEFTVQYTVKVYANATNWSVKGKLIDNTSKGLKTATDNKYIVFPQTSKPLNITTASVIFDNSMTTGSTDGITVAPDSGNASNTEFKKYAVTQTFKFTWGAAFGGKNPVKVVKDESIYTGAESAGATNGMQNATADLLVTNLRGLKALDFSGLKLNLTTEVTL